MRQPAPFPETLIAGNVKTYLDFLLEQWTGIDGSITQDAYAEYLRCFQDPETIAPRVLDYRAIDFDLAHDEQDRGRKLSCPVLLLWAARDAETTGLGRPVRAWTSSPPGTSGPRTCEARHSTVAILARRASGRLVTAQLLAFLSRDELIAHIGQTTFLTQSPSKEGSLNRHTSCP